MKADSSKTTKRDITGLILCGGAARRVGGSDKGLLKTKRDNFRPLIELQLKILRQQVSSLIISANRHLNVYKSYGYPVFQDRTGTSFDGPLQGVLNGLKHCQTEWLYVQPIDTPNLPINTIELLLKSISVDTSLSKSCAFFLASNEREHYLHLLLHRSCFDSLTAFVNRGGRRVKTYLEEIDAKAVHLGWKEEFFENLNDVVDYLV